PHADPLAPPAPRGGRGAARGGRHRDPGDAAPPAARARLLRGSRGPAAGGPGDAAERSAGRGARGAGRARRPAALPLRVTENENAPPEGGALRVSNSCAE